MGNEHKLSRANRESLTGPERVSRTDLGIAIAHAISPPGRRWTLDEIALFAGCTDRAILRIEQLALRRIRKRFLDTAFFADLKRDGLTVWTENAKPAKANQEAS